MRPAQDRVFRRRGRATAFWRQPLYRRAAQAACLPPSDAPSSRRLAGAPVPAPLAGPRAVGHKLGQQCCPMWTSQIPSPSTRAPLGPGNTESDSGLNFRPPQPSQTKMCAPARVEAQKSKFW